MPGELIVCGRKIGTYSDYDILDDGDSFDGFYPIEGVQVPAGNIAILPWRGIIECYNDAGFVTHRFDLPDVVRDLPRYEPLVPVGTLEGDA